MSALTRRTYDTDSIVLRRIFAVNPLTNQQFSSGTILGTSTNGAAFFINADTYFASIGLPTSASFPSTVVGLATANYISTPTLLSTMSGGLASTLTGLSNVAVSKLVAGAGISLSPANGIGEITITNTGSGGSAVSTENLTSTTQGLGTLNYVSTAMLISSVGGGLASTITGLGNLNVTQLVAGTNITLDPANGLGQVTINASGGGGGGISDAQLTSTTRGLGTLNYVSTAMLMSSVGGGLASTITGLGNLNVTQLVAGTNITLDPANGLGQVTINASGGGGGILDSQLTSTTQGLGTLKYVSTPTLVSTVGGGLASTVTGLGGVLVTKLTAGANIILNPANGVGQVQISASGGGGGILDTQLTSTTQGLGTLGYVSTAMLISTVGDGFASTITGLSNVNVTQLFAGTNITLNPTNGLGQVTITATGGGGGGISDGQLTSTTRGLGTLGYVSTAMLISTVGDGFASTITGLSNVNVTQLFAGTNITLSPANGLGQVFISAEGAAGGVSVPQLTSTTVGLGTLRYISSLQLTSTSVGLGRIGYVSTTQLTSTFAGLGRFYVSTLSTFSSFLTNNFYSSNIFTSTATTNLLSVSSISFGQGSGFVAMTNLRASYISTPSSFANNVMAQGISSFFVSSAQTFAQTAIFSSILFTSINPTFDRFYASTNTVTSTTNMFMQDREVGSYNPVKVIVSTVAVATGANDIYTFERDIGKYFLITATDYSPTVQLPTINMSLDGWNVVVRNMPASGCNVTVNSGVIAPGVTVSVLSDGISFYNI